MSARAHISCAVGALALDVDLSVGDGEVVALLGPNGAGKTSLLRCLAGLQAIDEGTIEIDGEVVDAPDRNLFVPTTHRRVGMAFQHYALFPALTVLENVAFGLRATGTRRDDARRVAAGWLERMRLSDHAQARPSSLSGGQAQRVALARALAPGPRLLLLDEPLAALDATTRATVRRELTDHLASYAGPTVMVTHDPIDAAIARRVVVLESGRVEQEGTLDEILARPRSRYVADLAGANLVRGTVNGGVLTTADGARVVIADAPDGAAWALIHPHSLTLSMQSTSTTSARNSWTGVVAGMHRVGDRVRVQIDGLLPLAAEVTAASAAELGLAPGSAVVVSVKATDIEVYPA